MIKHYNISYIYASLIVLTFGWMFLSCSEGHETGHEHDDHNTAQHEEHTEMVQLSDEALTEFSIEIDTAAAGPVRQHRDLTGEIVIDPDRLAHIIPRFPGIVKKVHKKIGDRVRTGEVLAVIESNESLAPYEVKSLIDGTVIGMHLTKGEVVNDNSHDIVVADLSYVWANLNVYQKDLDYLEIGQRTTVSTGSSTPQFTGKISYISPTLSEEKRTATARVIVANPKGYWRPGLFINAEVITSLAEVRVAVPKTALETYEGRLVVFVKSEEGYEPQPVKTGKENHTTVEILEGLAPGDLYVSKGGFTLKAELEKSAFGDGHAH